jgi:hypothetical protein
MLKSRINTL